MTRRALVGDMREGASRGAVAAAIFLLLTSGTVFAAGVTDTSRLAAGPLPERFILAEPRVGDMGVYVWDRVRVSEEGTVVVLNEHEILGFEWLPPSRESDHEGVRRDALMLHQWGWQPKDSYADPVTVSADGWERYAEPVFALEIGTDRILSYAYLSGATAAPERQDPASARTVQRMFVDEDDRFAPRCGGFPAFGGREVPLDRDIDLFRACMGFVNQMTNIDPHTPVRAVGTQALGEHDTVLFSAGDRYHVWYNASIPMPLRIAAQVCRFADVGWGCADEFDVLRLTSFRRGDVVLPDRPSSPPETDAVSWDMRPLVARLPDERGIEHPFPASEAVAAARAHPNGTTFAQALDRGTLTFLDYREHAHERETIRSWDLTAYDGTGTASVSVERRTGTPSSNVPGPLPLPPLQPRPPATDATTEVAVTVDRGNNPLPPIERVPSIAPTVASMWTRWRAFASESHANIAPNTWGFRVGCVMTAEGGCSIFVERWAGLDRSSSHDDGSSTTFVSRLAESDNEHRGHEMTLHESWYRGTASDAPTIEVASAAAKGQLTVIRSAAWVAPATPIVLGSILGAAVASLTYLFWPVLRFGALVMFTRNATPPDALRHPQRQRMMAAVRAQPGIHVPDLANILGRRRNPTEHHLAMLRRVGLVRVVREGPRRRVFACDADPAAHAQPVALASDLARQLLAARRANPALGVREAARVFGVSPGTVSYHLGRLRESRLLPETGE